MSLWMVSSKTIVADLTSPPRADLIGLESRNIAAHERLKCGHVGWGVAEEFKGAGRWFAHRDVLGGFEDVGFDLGLLEAFAPIEGGGASQALPPVTARWTQRSRSGYSSAT
jgi:hypothetical protein